MSRSLLLACVLCLSGCAKFSSLPLPAIASPETQDSATKNCSWIHPEPICYRAKWIDHSFEE